MVSVSNWSSGWSYRLFTDDWVHIWHTIVAEYSQLKFTKKSDRLPALSGVAQEIAIRRPDEKYLAGLWSGSLKKDLMWYTFRGMVSANTHQPWLPPTWTWAAVPDPVFFQLGCNDENSRFLFVATSASVSPVTTQYGPVTGGQLRLVAPVLHKTQAAPTSEFISDYKATPVLIGDPDVPGRHLEWEITHGDFNLSFHPDSDIEDLADHDYFGQIRVLNLTLLAGVWTEPMEHISSSLVGNRRTLGCLVIHRHQLHEHYRRVGYATLETDTAFEIERFLAFFKPEQEIVIS
jgi:hypothetical protein